MRLRNPRDTINHINQRIKKGKNMKGLIYPIGIGALTVCGEEQKGINIGKHKKIRIIQYLK